MRKYVTKRLKKQDFFKTDKLTEEVFDVLVSKYLDTKGLLKTLSKIDSSNLTRLNTYNKTIEKFGDLVKRDPNFSIINIKENLQINDGGKAIGKFRIKKKGSFSTTYDILNSHKKIIGTFSIIPSRKNIFIRTKIDNKGKKILFSEIDTFGQKPKSRPKVVAKYLIFNGYL